MKAKNSISPEEPKYRKAAKKKKHALKFTHRNEKIQETRRFLSPRSIKFASKKAALDALQAWADGKGFYGHFYSPENWNCEYVEL